MRTVTRTIFLSVIAVISFCAETFASHFYGADFYYTYVNGTTYTVTLVAYGDCSGSAFPSFVGATPEVQVIDNFGNVSQTFNLAAQNPTSGIEVTPVCAAQLNNTNCVNPGNPIPGVKKFVYSANVTLGSTATNWKFRFTGNMINNTFAGRSGTITNVINAGGTLMMLEATLNNTVAPNSSPLYTTIPTPFFCLGQPANYNPGTVDPNNDSLSYALVPGLDAQTNSIVSYVSGYSATQPLAVSSGTFNYNNTTGQLSFTPNAVQRSLVVNKVSEYRNGVLVGTSMREMTFVVLNCGNAPPQGGISGVTGSTTFSTTTVSVCKSTGTLSFHINPSDPDGNNINVSWSGVPSGASFTVSGNNTTTPAGTFTWNVTNVTPGTYNFFVTYTDNGCPLSSKQTQAYSVIVLPDPFASIATVTPATCSTKAVFNVTYGVAPPWKVKFYQGTSLIDSANATVNTITDSLLPGTYTMRIFNAGNCYHDSSIVIADPVTTKANITMSKPTCNAFSNGALQVTGYNSLPPYTYAVGATAYSSSGSFANLPAGVYIVHVKDAAGCVKDTSITLSDSLKVNDTVTKTDVICNGESNGTINVTASGGVGNYKYALNNGPLVTNSNFNNLAPAIYSLHTVDNIGCFFDTTITVADPPLLSPFASSNNIDCHGNATGSITLTAAGGVSPYTYKINTSAYGPSGNFTSLTKGTYMVSVKDDNGCIKTDTIILTEPPAINLDMVGVINPYCTGSSDGVILINASGGRPPFIYSVDNGPYQTFSHITNLPAGTYTVHVKDSNGCIQDSVTTLRNPEPVTVTDIDIARPTCKAYTNGTVTVLPTGGTPPYTFALDGNSYHTSNIFGALGSGSYLVKIRDSHNCELDTTVTVEDSLHLGGDITVNGPACYGYGNGSISIIPGGGVAPYRVALNNGAYGGNFSFTGLSAGTYILHVRDTLKCIADLSIPVLQPDPLKIQPTVTDNNCYGTGNAGKIVLDVTGGTKPYTYSWSTAAGKGNEADALPNGDYAVRVVDSNNCRDSIIATIAYRDCCTPFVAGGFTPNGDGRNDVLHVLVNGDMTLVGFSVFNRFGQRVFYTENINEGWDGRLNDVPQDAGTYFYLVQAKCGFDKGHTVTLKGDVVLVR